MDWRRSRKKNRWAAATSRRLARSPVPSLRTSTGRRRHQPIPIDAQVEVLSFTGDIAIEHGQPKVHAHVVLGKADGTAHGGHLLEGHIRPTLEIVITETPRHLFRRLDPSSGLALIDPTVGQKGHRT